MTLNNLRKVGFRPEDYQDERFLFLMVSDFRGAALESAWSEEDIEAFLADIFGPNPSFDDLALKLSKVCFDPMSPTSLPDRGYSQEDEEEATEESDGSFLDIPGLEEDDWVLEVLNGETLLGYTDWAEKKMERDFYDAHQTSMGYDDYPSIEDWMVDPPEQLDEETSEILV